LPHAQDLVRLVTNHDELESGVALLEGFAPLLHFRLVPIQMSISDDEERRMKCKPPLDDRANVDARLTPDIYELFEGTDASRSRLQREQARATPLKVLCMVRGREGSRAYPPGFEPRIATWRKKTMAAPDGHAWRNLTRRVRWESFGKRTSPSW
jgi:hypothetical protein